MKNCVEKIFGGLRGSYFSYALTYFSFYFGMGAFISVQSVYLMGLGKSTGEMSFIVSASSLFGIVLIPAVGYLNDRLKKPRLIAGLLLAAVAVLGAVFAASRSTWVLYVLNGLIMGLVSAISPVCERMAGSGRFRYGTVRVWGHDRIRRGGAACGPRDGIYCAPDDFRPLWRGHRCGGGRFCGHGRHSV